MARAAEGNRTIGIAALIAAIFAAIQFTQINAFGATWDEPLHSLWGRMFAQFWATGDRRQIDGMPGFGAYYGPVYYWINEAVANWSLQRLGLTIVAAHHVLNILMGAVAVGALFVLADRAFGRRIAIFATGFLVLFPAFIAHGHYNPSDMPLLAVVTALMLAALRAISSADARDGAVAGAVFGLALATKIVAIVAVPIVLLAYGAWLAATPEGREARSPARLQTQIDKVLAFVVAAAIATFAAWPSLWSDPFLLGRAFRAFLTEPFFTGTMVYFGQRYGGAELPWHYTPVSAFVETPMVTAVCAAIGVVAIVRSVTRGRDVEASVLVVAWVLVPLAASMKPGLIRYNGLRQFLFIIPGIALLAGIGLDALVTKWRGRIAIAALPAIAAAWLGIQVALVHPYEGSFVNEVMRPVFGRPIEVQWPFEYWAASYKEGFAWLDASAAPNARVCVPIVGGLAGWYPHRADLTFGCEAGARYTMFITSYAERKRFESGSYSLVFAVRRYDSDLTRIYEAR